MAVISISDLIKNAQKDKRTILTLELKEFGGEVKLQVPTASQILEYSDKYKTKEGNQSELEGFVNEVLYMAFVEPRLNSEELLTSMKCTSNPHSVVDKIFADSKFKIFEFLMESMDSGEEAIQKVGIVKN